MRYGSRYQQPLADHQSPYPQYGQPQMPMQQDTSALAHACKTTFEMMLRTIANTPGTSDTQIRILQDYGSKNLHLVVNNIVNYVRSTNTVANDQMVRQYIADFLKQAAQSMPPEPAAYPAPQAPVDQGGLYDAYIDEEPESDSNPSFEFDATDGDSNQHELEYVKITSWDVGDENMPFANNDSFEEDGIFTLIKRSEFQHQYAGGVGPDIAVVKGNYIFKDHVEMMSDVKTLDCLRVIDSDDQDKAPIYLDATYLTRTYLNIPKKTYLKLRKAYKKHCKTIEGVSAFIKESETWHAIDHKFLNEMFVPKFNRLFTMYINAGPVSEPLELEIGDFLDLKDIINLTEDIHPSAPYLLRSRKDYKRQCRLLIRHILEELLGNENIVQDPEKNWYEFKMCLPENITCRGDGFNENINPKDIKDDTIRQKYLDELNSLTIIGKRNDVIITNSVSKRLLVELSEYDGTPVAHKKTDTPLDLYLSSVLTGSKISAPYVLAYYDQQRDKVLTINVGNSIDKEYVLYSVDL